MSDRLRMFSWIAIAFSAIAGLHLEGWLPGSPTTVFVGPQGNDLFRGMSRDWPVRTIGRALSLVPQGGEVRILPGSYNERIHVARGGSPGKPLRIIADQSGTVGITSSVPLGSLRSSPWIKMGENLWNCQVKSPLYLLRGPAGILFRVPWGGIDALKTLTSKPKSFGAFWYHKNELTVFLPEGNESLLDRLEGHRAAPGPREWGEFKSANLWLEADHLLIEGIRFEFGIGSAISLWNCQHAKIVDCSMTACPRGILSGKGVRLPQKVTVERCLYHNFPQGDWIHSGWLNWNETYAGYSVSSLINSQADCTEVTNCVVTHFADGMQIGNSRSQVGAKGLIARNWFLCGTDDAIEFDSDACSIEVCDNLIYQSMVAFGTSPVRVGPVDIHDNISWDNNAHFKFLSPETETNSKKAEIRQVWARNNLLIGGQTWFWNPVIAIYDCIFAGNTLVNCHIPQERIPLGLIIPKSSDPAEGTHEEPNVSITEVPFKDLNIALKKWPQRPGPVWWEWEHEPATANWMVREIELTKKAE